MLMPEYKIFCFIAKGNTLKHVRHESACSSSACSVQKVGLLNDLNEKRRGFCGSVLN